MPEAAHSEYLAHDIVPNCPVGITIGKKVARSPYRSFHRHAICQVAQRRLSMNSHYLSSKLGRIALALFFLVGIGMVASTTAQAQWPYGQDPYRQNRRDRDDDRYRRNGQYGQYGNVYQVAYNQGYQDGQYTGSNDAQRRQSYNPQRSHFYRNGHGSYGGYGNNGRYGGGYQYQQAYREGFLRGYDQGYRQYGGYNNRRRGGYSRFPFPW
jgi:hypothetical protein